MNAHDVDALTPGRELDALISREVFDQCPHKDVNNRLIFTNILTNEFTTTTNFRCNDCGITSSAMFLSPRIPSRYSTDLNRALEIVEKALEKVEGYFDLLTDGKGRYLATFCTTAGATNSKSSTPAEAICKAALKFVRGQFNHTLS